MNQRARPYRSVLYVPASNERAMEKAKSLPVDAIIFDLEDAVAAGEKKNARKLLAKTLAEDGFGNKMKIVRINELSTRWGGEDAKAASRMECDAILLPKVESAGQLDLLRQISGETPIWAMMETPRGMMNAYEIARAPGISGMVMGTNDLAKDLQTRHRADRLPLMTSLGLCLLAAKTQGLVILDGVYNAFKDDEGLRAECEQGRDMGFDGKSLIHPAQVKVANEVFAPSDLEVDLARRQIEAFDAAERDGSGIAVVDGKIVENLHVITAREIISKADAIAEFSS